MEELIQKLKVSLADSVAFRLKTQQFHWNVEGPDFYEYHLLFQRIYEEVDGAIDTFGEQIRTLDGYAPLSPKRISELSNIKESEVTMKPLEMVRVLYYDNNMVLNTILDTYRIAERFNELGLSNFLQDRLTAHKTHLYLLRSVLKTQD
jgi:starvation-inducible DNA-binding protein